MCYTEGGFNTVAEPARQSTEHHRTLLNAEPGPYRIYPRNRSVARSLTRSVAGKRSM